MHTAKSKGDNLGRALDTGSRAFSSLLPEHSEIGNLIIARGVYWRDFILY